MYLHYGLLTILIVTALYTDIRSATISNRLTMSVTLLAFGLNAVLGGWGGLVSSMIGFGVSVGLFMILYACKAIGAGDVKLFGAIGALMGLHFTLYSMMYAIIYAGCIGLFILLIRKRLLAQMKQLLQWFIWAIFGRSLHALDYSAHHTVQTFPFMYAVVPAIMTTFYTSF